MVWKAQSLLPHKLHYLAIFLMLSSFFRRTLAGHQRRAQSAFVHPTRAFHSRRPYPSTATANGIRKESFLAVKVRRSQSSNATSPARPRPATLDSWDYDEEFGAFDYVPDEYDVEDMIHQQQGQVWNVEESASIDEGESMEESILNAFELKGDPKSKKAVPKLPEESKLPPVDTAAVSSATSEVESITPPSDEIESTNPQPETSVPSVDTAAASGVSSGSVEELLKQKPRRWLEAPTAASSTNEEPTSEVELKGDPKSRAETSPNHEQEASSVETWLTDPQVDTAASSTDTAEEPTSKVESRSTPPPPAETEPTTPQPDTSPRITTTARRQMTHTTDLDRLEAQLESTRQLLCEESNNPKFNPNSPRQVSVALFGEPGQPTNKDVLEALGASGNKLADHISQFRHLNREINKRKKKQEHKEKGTYAKSVYTVKRTNGATSETAEETPTPAPAANNNKSKTADLSVYGKDPLLLVDASAYIFRAYYAFPPLHRDDGTPIGAVLGFCNMLNRLVLTTMMEGKQPRIVLVFDAPGKTFRHGIYELYKANRPEAPVDLIPQFRLIREAAKAYGIVQLEAPTYEADDVIATLATMALKEGIDCNILSGDKDLMQLVTPSNDGHCVQMIDPMTMSRVSYEDVVEKWGVGPEKLGDVLALAGDSSDNIPGVPGIGPKIAAQLIGSFGSLENLLENAEEVKQKGRRQKLQDNLEQARLSRVLVELERNVPMDYMTFPEGTDQVSELRMAPMDAEGLVQFFDDMGLWDLKRRFQNRLELQKGIKATPRKPPTRSRYEPRPKAQIPRPEDFADVPF